MTENIKKNTKISNDDAGETNSNGKPASIKDELIESDKATITSAFAKPSKMALLFQYSVAVSAGLSAMVAGAWLAWPSSTIKPLQNGTEGFIVDENQISTLVALMDFGNFLSPIPSGYLMDSIGRKLALLIAALVYTISSLCAIFGDDAWYLYIARTFAGLGKGVAFAVVPIFLGEIASVQIRGALSTMFIGFLNLGMVFGFVIGPLVSYSIFNIIMTLIPVSFFISFIFVPESPYYLIMKGREGSARKALSRFRCVKKEDAGSGSILDIELQQMIENVKRDMQNKARFIDVFTSPGKRKALCIISLLAIFQRLSGISPTLAYSTTIMPVLEKEVDGHIVKGPSRETFMILFSIVLVLANYVALPLVDRIGRKPLLIFSSITSAVVMGGSGVYYYLEYIESDVTNIKWIPYFCLLAFGITYSLGIGFLPSTLVAELFPTNVKSYAGSISAILLAATSFGVNKFFLKVQDLWGVHIMYLIFCISSFVCAIFCIFYLFETKGKTFNEIQDILNNASKIREHKQNKETITTSM